MRKLSLTPEDVKYFEAICNNDMETAQRMVDDIARDFLNDENFANNVCIENEQLGKVIRNAIKNALAKLRELLAELRGYVDDRRLRAFDLENLLDDMSKAERLWANGLQTAIANKHAGNVVTDYNGLTGEASYNGDIMSANNNALRKSMSVAFKDVLHKIANWTDTDKRKFENAFPEHFYMGTTPNILVNEMGYAELPMIISRKHLYMITHKSGFYKEDDKHHYHGLSDSEVEAILKHAEDPMAIIVDDGGKTEKNERGEVVGSTHAKALKIYTGDLDDKKRYIVLIADYARESALNVKYGVEQDSIVINGASTIYGIDIDINKELKNAEDTDRLLLFNKGIFYNTKTSQGSQYVSKLWFTLETSDLSRENIALWKDSVKGLKPNKAIVRENQIKAVEHTISWMDDNALKKQMLRELKVAETTGAEYGPMVDTDIAAANVASRQAIDAKFRDSILRVGHKLKNGKVLESPYAKDG